MIILLIYLWVATLPGTLSTEEVNCKLIQVFLDSADIPSDMTGIRVVI